MDIVFCTLYLIHSNSTHTSLGAFGNWQANFKQKTFKVYYNTGKETQQKVT